MTLGSGKKAVIKVKVQKTAVKTTKLTLPKTATVKVKKTLTLKPVLTPVTSSEKITYTTSNKKIATVNKNHRKVSILSNQLKRKRIGMANGKNRLNTIYISRRLQECLRPISYYAMTTVTAPMGYGKTTAIDWYLTKQLKEEQAVLIRISIYSDNLSIFWKSVQNAFSFAGLDFLKDYECPEDEASAGFLMDLLCHSLACDRIYYIFIDDFHLLTDKRVTEFLYILTNRLPSNIHLVVASRNHFLLGEEIVRLGGKLYQIGEEQLRLQQDELSVYTHRCGTNLSDQQIKMLLYSSEGWFSAVYLNLCFFVKWGELPGKNGDIYEMFSASMLNPLSEERREFLCTMGLADEFTAEMAKYITQKEDTSQILQALTAKNAFVTRLSDGKTFRFHHMMKECAKRNFLELDREKQVVYYNRYGRWYEIHKLYIHALSAYWNSENYDAMLRVVQEDAGILLASQKPEQVLGCLLKCPASILKEHPLAILVLMRSMFNWKNIPKMLELKEILLESIEEHPDLSDAERGNLLGECDLIMSFLMYNDISRMSELHRSASALMTRPAISIRKEGGWTFGSPSVLMMFHRELGALEAELKEMYDCMPHYYKITDGHGLGAGELMGSEARFLQGNFLEAQIQLEQAYAKALENGQENIALCCDFLAYRMSLFVELEIKETLEQRRERVMKAHNTSWLNMFESICAYYYSLTGLQEQIPGLFGEHRLSSVNFLAPGKPMMEMIENQVYLAQGAYAKVVGRSAGILEICERLHYNLVALYIQIQVAASWEKLGKSVMARNLLQKSLEQAMPDKFLVPFAENYPYLKEILERLSQKDKTGFVSQVIYLGKIFENRCNKLKNANIYPEIFSLLTEREQKLVQLMGEHLSNKEIGSRMFLSEGTVKQYINQIYSKLQITGDTRTKRQQLLEMLHEKKSGKNSGKN